MVGSSFAVPLVVWVSSAVPLVLEFSRSMSADVVVSLAAVPAVWDPFDVSLSSEGEKAVVVVVVVVRPSAPLILLSVDIWLVGLLSRFDVQIGWSPAEHLVVAWPMVKRPLLLLLFVWLGGCVFTEESAGFTVHESWLNSGSWWTIAGSGVTWFNPTGSLATWLLVDGSLTADCQLLEQRMAGMLQKEKHFYNQPKMYFCFKTYSQ